VHGPGAIADRRKPSQESPLRLFGKRIEPHTSTSPDHGGREVTVRIGAGRKTLVQPVQGDSVRITAR